MKKKIYSAAASLTLLGMVGCANLKRAIDPITGDLEGAGNGFLETLKSIGLFLLGLLPGFLQRFFGL